MSRIEESRVEGIVIESTYNWYWLVDGLPEHTDDDSERRARRPTRSTKPRLSIAPL
jgi:hypothetical protein